MHQSHDTRFPVSRVPLSRGSSGGLQRQKAFRSSRSLNELDACTGQGEGGHGVSIPRPRGATGRARRCSRLPASRTPWTVRARSLLRACPDCSRSCGKAAVGTARCLLLSNGRALLCCLMAYAVRSQRGQALHACSAARPQVVSLLSLCLMYRY